VYKLIAVFLYRNVYIQACVNTDCKLGSTLYVQCAEAMSVSIETAEDWPATKTWLQRAGHCLRCIEAWAAWSKRWKTMWQQRHRLNGPRTYL